MAIIDSDDEDVKPKKVSNPFRVKEPNRTAGN